MTAKLLRSKPAEGHDRLDEKLLAADAGLRLRMARRLERGVAEFDTATIGTIHSICARVLRMAGIEPGEAGDEDLLERVVAEAVNDAVVTEAAAGRAWDEPRLADYYVWVGTRNAGGGVDGIGDNRTVRAESAQDAADLVAAEYDDGEVVMARSQDYRELADATAEQADHD
jgi:hypothetical protein